MDGKRHGEVLAFADWKARQADYPLPEDWWISERQADLRAMQRRLRWKRVATGIAMVLGCMAATGLIVWGVLALGDWLTGRF